MANNASYKVFRGVGVMVVGVKSKTSFSVVPVTTDDGEVDLTVPPFTVDLTATPQHGRWDHVQVDDRGVDAANAALPFNFNGAAVNLGITTIGANPADSFLQSAFIGAVYLENGRYAAMSIGTAVFPWPPAQYALYQLTSIAYRANVPGELHAGKRYHGFRGTITAVAGTQIQVSFPRAAGAALGPWTFDTTNVDDCLVTPPAEALSGLPPGEVLLTSNPAVGQTGPIFVALPAAVSHPITGPKIPIGLAQ